MKTLEEVYKHGTTLDDDKILSPLFQPVVADIRRIYDTEAAALASNSV